MNPHLTLITLVALAGLSHHAGAATFTVINTNDSGAGRLMGP